MTVSQGVIRASRRRPPVASGPVLGLVLLVAVLPVLGLPGPAHSQAAPETAAPLPSESVPEIPPPTDLAAVDVPNDGGERIALVWTLSASDTMPGALDGYIVLRAESAGGPFAPVDTVGPGLSTFTDRTDPAHTNRLRNGTPYWYRVDAWKGVALASSNAAGPAIAHLSWFNTDRLNIFLYLALFTVFFISFIEVARKGKELFIRKIAGLDAIEEAIGRATEMGKAVLFVPGIDDVNNIQTIYGMVILGNVAKMVAKYETPLIVPVCKPFVVPLAEETVKSGYLDAGHPEAYNPNNIRYLSDEQFAFTAAVDGIMLRERPAANLYMGSFFAESLILAETGFSTGAIQIAGTANIHQLPFFVVACDFTLIGEEFFAATAYISREHRLVGTLKGTDYMKGALVLLLLAGTALESFGVTGFTTWWTIR